jgi:hypothetical protein
VPAIDTRVATRERRPWADNLVSTALRPGGLQVCRSHLVCDALAWLSRTPSLRAIMCSIPSCASPTPLHDAPRGACSSASPRRYQRLFRSLISIREPTSRPTYLRCMTVDKRYRYLRLCLMDGLADAVAAERRHQRFASEAETTCHRTMVEADFPICSYRRPRCEPLRTHRVQLSVAKEIVAQEPRPQSPWGSRRLQRQPLPRARHAFSGLPNGVEL